MAMAGQAQLDRIGSSVRAGQDVIAWRLTLKYIYYWCLLGAGIGLVVFLPPQFTFSIPAIVAASVVAVFLVINERPQPAFQSGGFAPLTAILAAATATISWWSLPLAIVGWSAVHWRVREQGRPLGSFVSSLCGQIGMAILATYAMVAVYTFAHSLSTHAPDWLSALIVFLGIVAVGMTWQTINNGLVVGGFLIAGQPASFVRYWRSGFVASLWAYLLAGMFAFGGLLGTVVFYYVVAHTRMFDRIIKAVEAADEHDFMVAQCQLMVHELLGLLSPDDVAFAGDVRYLSMQIARKAGLPKPDIENISLAAELHDIGKCKLQSEVRSGVNLTPAQEQERLRYPMLGAQVLRKAPKVFSEELAYAVEHQCEAFDGSGYPHGMKGERIPVASRVIAISRDYLGLLTGRGSTQACGKQDALSLLRQRAGAQYDPALVDLLCREIA
jgi:hypothetical protein